MENPIKQKRQIVRLELGSNMTIVTVIGIISTLVGVITAVVMK